MDFYYHYSSAIGNMTMASDGSRLTGLWFDGQKYFADTLRTPHQEKLLPVFSQTLRWLNIYFRGEIPPFTPALHIRTTPFRQKVCKIMLQIPYGETRTYGQIANQLAKQCGLVKMSAQAVGGAVGHNPISLIIPCHRVIGHNGNLTGYAGGMNKKLKLLQLEKIQLPR